MRDFVGESACRQRRGGADHRRRARGRNEGRGELESGVRISPPKAGRKTRRARENGASALATPRSRTGFARHAALAGRLASSPAGTCAWDTRREPTPAPSSTSAGGAPACHSRFAGLASAHAALSDRFRAATKLQLINGRSKRRPQREASVGATLAYRHLRRSDARLLADAGAGAVLARGET